MAASKTLILSLPHVEDQALALFVAIQILARGFHPFLYWAAIVASTTAGTALADFADRSLGIGYMGGSLLLLACVIASLGIWYTTERSLSVSAVWTSSVHCCHSACSCS